jgi:hypothetical protein
MLLVQPEPQLPLSVPDKNNAISGLHEGIALNELDSVGAVASVEQARTTRSREYLFELGHVS